MSASSTLSPIHANAWGVSCSTYSPRWRSLPLFIPVALLLVLSACASPMRQASRYKMLVLRDGIHRLTAQTMAAAGVDVSRIDPNSIQIFSGDREIAARVQGEGAGLVIDFYAQATDSPYSPANVYWLGWGTGKGKRMSQLSSERPKGTFSASFRDVLTFSSPSVYIPQPGPAANSWFWQTLVAPAAATLDVTLPAALPETAQMRLILQGGSQDVVVPDHHVKVSFNGEEVGQDSWDGQGEHLIDMAIPARSVHKGGNTVGLSSPGDTGASVDVIMLRSIQIAFTRESIAESDALEFDTRSGSASVRGFAGDQIDLYDITDPADPIWIQNATVGSGAITFGIDDDKTHRWIAVGPTGRTPVTQLVPMQSADLRSSNRQADYLVIAHPDFVNVLQPLIRWRSEHGLKAAIVTTSEIYDEFGGGNESPLAIRDFLDYAEQKWTKPAPRFVLLVGKASYDYRDYLKAPNKNLVPAFLVDTPHLGQAGSDNWYAMNVETAYPAFAIGRIPAKTADQVSRVVDKIIGYESTKQKGEWRNRVLFSTDDDETTFDEMADSLSQKAEPGMEGRKVYLGAYRGDVERARTELLKEWNSGAFLLTYIGHGSLDTWAAGPLLSSADVNELKNGERLPILLTPTCLDGFFYHPQKDSLAEDLLFKPDGGVIAAIAPTGLSTTFAQRQLMHALFREVFEGATPTLGEALMRAKLKLNAANQDEREVIDIFGVLGDPALDVRK